MEIVLCPCQLHSDHRTCDSNEVCHGWKPKTVGTANSIYVNPTSGRNLSAFDRDVLKVLCCVLKQTGPVTFNGNDVGEIDVDQLVVEVLADKDTMIASYGEVE